MREDAAHVWQCQGEGVSDVWDKSLVDLETWFAKMNTDPDIKYALLSHLKSWRDAQPQSASNPFLLEDILTCQSRIGWRRFFEGWIVKDWTDAQQAYYKISKSLRSGRRWTIELIKKLWDVAWDLWEHRNSILHKEQNVVTTQVSRSLNRQVSSAYTDLHSLLLKFHDKHLLALKLSHLLKKDDGYKKVWLHHAQAVIQGSSKKQKRSLNIGDISGMRNRMKSFLTSWRHSGNP
jgi:hypothetical protein